MKTSKEPQTDLGLKEHLAMVEKEWLLSALTTHGWNKAEAARTLRISRPQVHYLIQKHRLVQPSKECVNIFDSSENLDQNS
jgi:transcriptional regulator with GAF, ATPase, and Fis domain